MPEDKQGFTDKQWGHIYHERWQDMLGAPNYDQEEYFQDHPFDRPLDEDEHKEWTAKFARMEEADRQEEAKQAEKKKQADIDHQFNTDFEKWKKGRGAKYIPTGNPMEKSVKDPDLDKDLELEDEDEDEDKKEKNDMKDAAEETKKSVGEEEAYAVIDGTDFKDYIVKAIEAQLAPVMSILKGISPEAIAKAVKAGMEADTQVLRKRTADIAKAVLNLEAKESERELRDGEILKSIGNIAPMTGISTVDQTPEVKETVTTSGKVDAVSTNGADRRREVIAKAVAYEQKTGNFIVPYAISQKMEQQLPISDEELNFVETVLAKAVA